MRDKIVIKSKVILIVLLTVALFLRIYRINFNLPYLYHIDESGYIRLILAFFENFNLRLRDFQHPHFYDYINFFIYGLFFLGGYAIKKFQNILDFQIFFTINFPLFLLISRYFSAIVGTANVILVYLIAKKIVNVRVGLIASAFLTFNYLHAQYSHLVCPRILETFFLSFAFLFILDIFYFRKQLSYILAGCVIGLAIGTEYTGFFIIVPFLLAHFLSDKNIKRNLLERCNDVKLYSGIFAITAVFFMVSPHSLVNLRSFIYGIYVEFIKFRTGYVSLRYLGANPFVYYWMVFLHNTGFIFLFLSLSGLIYCLYKRSRVLIVLFSFPLTMICFLFSTYYVLDQYMLPVIPFLTVIIGLFLNFILEIVYKFKPLKAKIMKNSLYILVCSSLLMSGLEVLRFGYYRSQKDARILAKEWLDDNVAANTKILTDIAVNSLPLESSNLNLQGNGSINPPGLGAGGYLGKYIEYIKFLKSKNLDPYSEQFIKITRNLEQIKKYNVSEYGFPVNSKLPDTDNRGLINPLAYYIDNGYKYVILGTFGLLSKNTDPRCEPYKNFYAELESRGKLIKNFPQKNLVFFRYHAILIPEEIRIYKIGDE